MATNTPLPNPGTLRQEIWDFVSKYYRCLIDVARTVAIAKTSPSPDKRCQLCPGQKCPKPINYLINAAPPVPSAKGLTSHLLTQGYVLAGSSTCLGGSTPVFNGCNFVQLAMLANAKNGTSVGGANPDKLCGFGLNGIAGLSILLGPWADYCLWCWSQDPLLDKRPILILGKDNSPFAEETVREGQDWGVDQVIGMGKVIGTGNKAPIDKSTRLLFDAIEFAGKKSPRSIVQHIAQERILVCNAWPWFRCGQESCGDKGIHSDFSKVPQVRDYLTALLEHLKPRTVICLGKWAAPPSESAVPCTWICSLPLPVPPPTFFCFRHPAAIGFWTKAGPDQNFIDALLS